MELYISNVKWVSNIVSKQYPQQQMLFMYDVEPWDWVDIGVSIWSEN